MDQTADIHVVLDDLSTHDTPEAWEWQSKNPHVLFHLTPIGYSWLNQIEIWFGTLARQTIRRGAFSSLLVLIKQIPLLHHLLEHGGGTIHLDRDRWRGPRERPTPRGQTSKTRQ